jgi:hypothetical protein
VHQSHVISVVIGRLFNTFSFVRQLKVEIGNGNAMVRNQHVAFALMRGLSVFIKKATGRKT